MTKSSFVTVKITGSVAQSGLGNIWMGTHGWNDVEKIKLFGDELFSISILKGGLISVDFN